MQSLRDEQQPSARFTIGGFDTKVVLVANCCVWYCLAVSLASMQTVGRQRSSCSALSGSAGLQSTGLADDIAPVQPQCRLKISLFAAPPQSLQLRCHVRVFWSCGGSTKINIAPVQPHNHHKSRPKTDTLPVCLLTCLYSVLSVLVSICLPVCTVSLFSAHTAGQLFLRLPLQQTGIA